MSIRRLRTKAAWLALQRLVWKLGRAIRKRDGCEVCRKLASLAYPGTVHAAIAERAEHLEIGYEALGETVARERVGAYGCPTLGALCFQHQPLCQAIAAECMPANAAWHGT